MRILFLTNNKNSQPLIDWLNNSAKEEVIIWDEKLSKENIEKIRPDLVVSYNYKFIIKKEILSLLPNRVINLHISLLPYNRGANPNVWSFIEDTPKGVTIHYVDEGIDTGDILFQKEVIFEEEKETLASSYEKLHKEIQSLFIENWGTIKNFSIIPEAQPTGGSTHSIKDFDKIKNILGEEGWDIGVTKLKRRYKKYKREKIMVIKISHKLIGKNQPIFIVAELSANHLQKFDLAIETIKAIKEAGADAVKLQTYTPDTMTINADNEYFQIKQGTLWDGKTLYQLYQEAYTPWEWQPKLKKIAEDLGLIYFSSPFDKTAVDFLEEMKVPAYKVASFEITDIPLIEYIASKRKPVIISTGIAALSDIEEAVTACKRVGNNQIALLKCTSEYPTPLEDVNLRTIPDLAERFNVVVGLSDHTLGISVPVAAVALGVKIIEKHFILDRKLGGPDSAFSLEPHEFKEMVKSVREVEKALGEVSYELTDNIKKSREFSRSLFIIKDTKQGEKLTEENVRSIRPGFGLLPKYLSKIIGRKAKKDIKKGTPLSWDLVE